MDDAEISAATMPHTDEGIVALTVAADGVAL
jgi:hypothetical protein